MHSAPAVCAYPGWRLSQAGETALCLRTATGAAQFARRPLDGRRHLARPFQGEPPKGGARRLGNRAFITRQRARASGAAHNKAGMQVRHPPFEVPAAFGRSAAMWPSYVAGCSTCFVQSHRTPIPVPPRGRVVKLSPNSAMARSLKRRPARQRPLGVATARGFGAKDLAASDRSTELACVWQYTPTGMCQRASCMEVALAILLAPSGGAPSACLWPWLSGTQLEYRPYRLLEDSGMRWTMPHL